jgi:hypothetical protein
LIHAVYQKSLRQRVVCAFPNFFQPVTVGCSDKMLPTFPNIETPILHELNAVGGKDDVRFLYERLISYFPQITEAEISQIRNGKNQNWRKAVQKAGKSLDEQNLIRRERGFWVLTDAGKHRIGDETSGIILATSENETLSHTDAQDIICKIGEFLGFYSEKEFEYYDVIWREGEKSPRIDSAFAKLKRAFDAQRSKPFLILSSERDSNRAFQSLNREFRELETVITILSFAELRKIHENLSAIRKFLPAFLEK